MTGLEGLDHPGHGAGVDTSFIQQVQHADEAIKISGLATSRQWGCRHAGVATVDHEHGPHRSVLVASTIRAQSLDPQFQEVLAHGGGIFRVLRHALLQQVRGHRTRRRLLKDERWRERHACAHLQPRRQLGRAE